MKVTVLVLMNIIQATTLSQLVKLSNCSRVCTCIRIKAVANAEDEIFKTKTNKLINEVKEKEIRKKKDVQIIMVNRNDPHSRGRRIPSFLARLHLHKIPLDTQNTDMRTH